MPHLVSCTGSRVCSCVEGGLSPRWFCGQIQRLAQERDTYKSLAEERGEQLQTWERALQFMPRKAPTA